MRNKMSSLSKVMILIKFYWNDFGKKLLKLQTHG